MALAGLGGELFWLRGIGRPVATTLPRVPSIQPCDSDPRILDTTQNRSRENARRAKRASKSARVRRGAGS
jgi:hypothetical protein